jgi:hypothetical protein
LAPSTHCCVAGSEDRQEAAAGLLSLPAGLSLLMCRAAWPLSPRCLGTAFYGGLWGQAQGIVSAGSYMQRSVINAELRSAISSVAPAGRGCPRWRGEGARVVPWIPSTHCCVAGSEDRQEAAAGLLSLPAGVKFAEVPSSLAAISKGLGHCILRRPVGPGAGHCLRLLIHQRSVINAEPRSAISSMASAGAGARGGAERGARVFPSLQVLIAVSRDQKIVRSDGSLRKDGRHARRYHRRIRGARRWGASCHFTRAGGVECLGEQFESICATARR